MLLTSDISLSQIAIFLNGPTVINMIMLVTSVGVGVIFLSLIYHWGAYRPRTALSLGANEHIVKVFHKHWFIFLINVAITALLIYAPKALSYVPKEFTDWASSFKPFLDAIYSAWVAFLSISLLVIATNYFLDIWILTNKRLVDVEQKSLFRRSIVEMRLEHIEDIHVKISGVIGTLLGIGTLEVDSGGPVKEFSLINIASPAQSRDLISSQASKKLDEVKKVEVVS